MIPASLSDVYTLQPTWQQELSQARLTPAQLAQRLQLPISSIEEMAGGDKQFPIRATESYLQRIQIGNLQDPLLKQILPTQHENSILPGYSSDPVGDCRAICTNGVLKKYVGRALLITTAACAIHCRYCFRRAYPYQDHSLDLNQKTAIDWLQSDTSIHEVILSGGDPLVLSDARLTALIDQIEAIPHLKTLRLHSRIPVVLPRRITPQLLQRLQQSRLQVVMVIHSNHPNELDSAVATALQALDRHGITLLNQSVLLNGVNNQVEILEQLSHTLFSLKVLPYYLHLLDRVSGSHHFDLAEAAAIELHHQLRGRLPGYLLPRLVREIEGASSKTSII